MEALLNVPLISTVTLAGHTSTVVINVNEEPVFRGRRVFGRMFYKPGTPYTIATILEILDRLQEARYLAYTLLPGYHRAYVLLARNPTRIIDSLTAGGACLHHARAALTASRDARVCRGTRLRRAIKGCAHITGMFMLDVPGMGVYLVHVVETNGYPALRTHQDYADRRGVCDGHTLCSTHARNARCSIIGRAVAKEPAPPNAEVEQYSDAAGEGCENQMTRVLTFVLGAVDRRLECVER
jgi:hypothetical protein